MSQRVKKPGRPAAEDSQGKRRRRRPSGSDADEDGTRSGSNSGGNGSLTGMWTPRHLNDLKVSSIYNRNSAEAPAELYRKDLISAMKLPDSEPLTPEEYWLITDSWKQEWEKGVQVPVNPESLPEPEVKLIQPVAERSHDFRLPKKKYVRVTHDDFFNPDYHQLVSTAARAEKVCSYDLDDVDAAWLGCSNADRAMQNTTLISEFLMEQVIEELELQCWEQVQTILKSQEGLGIEYDENVICDVCRSPESEEGNEMVFCDSCNICVHQACYGITTIPSGSWLCRTCTLGIKPTCILCPNVGGAMKATRSGHTWAHVACAIWIPEVSIGSVEKMEPITKISSIPQSRWSLICVLCKEKTGACIQCSVKTCKTAYHVTCAFKNGLEMKPIIVDENAEDGIKLRSYCQKHSVNTKKDKSQSGSETDDAEKKKLKAMTAEERNQARAEKLQQIEAEFYKYVRLKDVSQNLAVDMDIVMLIYNYWKLKRKSLNNRPLVPPRPETTQLLTQQQEQDLEQMKMFVQLRQDLERVRNLCYMVSRREKLSRSFFRLREQTFQKQLALLTEKNDLTQEERHAIINANHGPSIYDQLYSHQPSTSTNASTSTTVATKSAIPDYDTLITLIAGIDAKKELLNGVVKNSGTASSSKRQGKAASASSVASTSAAVAAAAAAVTDAVNNALSNSASNSVSGKDSSVINSAGDKTTGSNPYKKQFVNGARRRNLLGRDSGASSHSESESERAAASTSDNTTPGKSASKKAATATKRPSAAANATTKCVKGGNRKPLSYLFDSDSSENAANANASGKKGAKSLLNKSTKGGKTKSKTVSVTAGAKSTKAVKTTSYLSDSDELELPAARTTNKGAAGTGKDIYSDSEESVVEDVKPVLSTPTSKKDPKLKNVSPVAGKEKVGRKAKNAGSAQGSLQSLAEKQVKKEKVDTSATPTKTQSVKEKLALQTTPKGKGKATGTKKGKNKGAFDPTELIVPQREAAKKATESIRSVKQKTKDQQASADCAQEGGSLTTTPAVSKESLFKETGKPGSSKSVSKATISTLSESDNEEEEEEEEKVLSRPSSRRGKSPERKISGKTSKKCTTANSQLPVAGAAIEDDTESKDEFEFDVGKDGSSKNVPSYVPQRQAAKKAAEHIRSGLSNIVAARLIIEDEMEMTRKKQKLDKGQVAVAGGKGVPGKEMEEDDESQLPADSSKIENAVAEAAKRVTNKDRAPAKVPVKVGKGSKKDAPSAAQQLSSSAAVPPLNSGPKATAAAVVTTKEARGVRDTPDWPFLDKGSQSACRRSRERSSSSTSSSGSSGSSSSGSSCSSRSSSASSSRSSSAESASPEPSSPVVTKKASSQQQQIISPVTSKLSSATAQDTGPGRKLKTSERCPNNRTRLRAETPPREKPTAKGSRSAKLGSRGGDPFRSAFSPSPEPELKPASPKPTQSKKQPQQQSRQQQQFDKRSGSTSDHHKVSPLSKANEQQQRKQQQQQQSRLNKSKSRSPGVSESKSITPESAEKKGARRKGESPSAARKISNQIEKDSDSETTTTAPSSKTSSSSSGEKTSQTKAPLEQNKRPLAKHTGPHLSSESESETPVEPVNIAKSGKPNQIDSSRPRNISHSQLETTSVTSSPQRKRKSQSESGNLGLSDSDESGTEEKENAAVVSNQHHQRGETELHQPSTPSVPSKSSLKTPQKNSTTSGGALPSQSILSPLTPTENKDKEHQQHQSRLSDAADQPETKRPRLDGAVVTAPSTSGQMKSIFSPPSSTGGARDGEGEILDFDSELYDLAKSVVTDEYNHGDDGPNSGSLSFSFSQDVFNREDNKEDSARATLNLVEKLRLQHARKSGNHRPSTESSIDTPCDSLLEDIPGKSDSRPGSSLHEDRKDSLSEISEPAQISEVMSEGKSSHSQTPSFEPSSGVKSPQNLLHPAASPDRAKLSIQGDERWVPPSGTSGQPPPESNQRHSQVFIPNASQASYTNIPEQQPSAVSAQQPQSHHSHVEAIDAEKLSSPSPTAYHTPSSGRGRSNHPSTSGELNDKTGNIGLSVDTHPISSPTVPSPMVSPGLPQGLHQGRQSQPGLTQQPPFPTNAAAMAAAMAAMAAADTTPGNISAAAAAAAAAGVPFGANPFMYPALANNPALATVFAAAAAAATAGGPPYLQVPMPKTSPGLGPGSPVSIPQQGAPGFPPFIPPALSADLAAVAMYAQQHQKQQQQQHCKTVQTPTQSPGITSGQQQPATQQQQQRRSSDVVAPLDGKLPLSSPLVSVATSMPPPLAKPPLTSPSILLAANNVKTVTPPPLQSAVAHIIESVVNNHQSSTTSTSSTNINTSLPKTTLSMDLHLQSTMASTTALTSTNAQVKTPLTSPVVANFVLQKQQAPSGASDGLATDIGAVLANRTTENIIAPAMNKSARPLGEESSPIVPAPTAGVPHPAVSPKTTPPTAGRGRRASTPRATAAAMKAAEKLSGVNAVIEDMIMISPQPKTKGRKGSAQSPGRGKAPATPGRRGGSSGRGKGKGKNFVGVRKDLAGTVYDIDFDEFEENSEEKIDLRALRERRKSSDVHAHLHEHKEKETKHSSRKSSKSSVSHFDNSHNSSLNQVIAEEKEYWNRSSHLDKKEARERKTKTKDVDRHHHHHHRESREESHSKHPPHQPPLVTTISVSKGEVVSSTNKIPPPAQALNTPPIENTSSDEKESVRPILQTNPILPGPVDMRTYSASTTTTRGTEQGKIDFPTSLNVKDPTSEIASLFMSSATSTAVAAANEIEDVEKALEVLVSTPKTQTGTQQPPASTTGPATPLSSEPSAISNQLPTTSTSSAVNDVISSINVSSVSSQANKLQNNTQPAAPPAVSASVAVNNLISGGNVGSGVTSTLFGQQTQMKDSMDVPVVSSQTQPSTLVPSAVSSASESDLPRNQLKFKIKGPFSDANYSSSNSIHPGSIPTHPHLHPSHPLQQQNSVGVSGHPLAHAGYPPPGFHSQTHGGPESASFQHHQHHHQQWMMSSMMSSNTSNLRRMRKKELLRQYWTQDMNMDGGSNPPGFPPGSVPPPSHMPDFSGVAGGHQGHHPHHPLGRAVITIPKAVASMSIIPTKEDYRFDTPSGNESNDSNGAGGPMGELWSGKGDHSNSKSGIASSGKPEGTQRKRRSRGIYREMAALGIITPDAPRERRRDRASAANATSNSGAGGGDSSDSNSRKRVRGSNKPSRSTFIPPTLAESVDSLGGTKGDKTILSSGSSGNVASGKAAASSNAAVSAVVNVVNHPTPKLKIKFGDLSNPSGSMGTGNSSGGMASSLMSNNTNHFSDSDKETPNKKAKGRPPKKRGLPDASSSSSSATSASTSGFSMEELKRQSMKYREKIMKDYAMAEQQEILKLSGTRRRKRNKRKAGASAAGSETDDASSVRSKSPEVKVIDGPKPKLILRFGKSRSNAASDSNSTSGDKVSENGLPGSGTVTTENSSQGPDGPIENDSGFTGSSEGSTGSAPENFKGNTVPKAGGNKEKSVAASVNNNNNNNNNNNSNGSSGNSGSGSSSGSSIRNGSGSGNNNGDKVLVLELDSKASEKLQNLTSTSSTSSNAPKGSNNPSSESSSTGEKYVPIRLKLSRCYEGYSLKNKDGLPGSLDAGVERENGGASNATKQSDSCQVR